jgi:hypothetical protein
LAGSKTGLITQFDTYERVLYHEYFHVAMMGHNDRIPDFKSILPSTNGKEVTVYGAGPASELAHLHYRPGEAVNLDVYLNADNYAWLATNVWVRNRWGSKDDPFNYLDKIQPGLPSFRKRDVETRQLDGSTTDDDFTENEQTMEISTE